MEQKLDLRTPLASATNALLNSVTGFQVKSKGYLIHQLSILAEHKSSHSLRRHENFEFVCLILFSVLVWMSTKNPNTNVSDRQAVPFLPVNPEFSSTRNQGRQKLARFNAREFATLIIDLLSDARRRQQGMSVPIDSCKQLNHRHVILYHNITCLLFLLLLSLLLLEFEHEGRQWEAPESNC